MWFGCVFFITWGIGWNHAFGHSCIVGLGQFIFPIVGEIVSHFLGFLEFMSKLGMLEFWVSSFQIQPSNVLLCCILGWLCLRSLWLKTIEPHQWSIKEWCIFENRNLPNQQICVAIGYEPKLQDSTWHCPDNFVSACHFAMADCQQLVIWHCECQWFLPIYWHSRLSTPLSFSFWLICLNLLPLSLVIAVLFLGASACTNAITMANFCGCIKMQ